MASYDSDDEDLKAAIAMSLAEPPLQSINTLSGILGNRKAMEEERLARLARKRHRSISPPDRSPRKARKVEQRTDITESDSKLNKLSSLVQQGQEGRKPETARAAIDNMRADPLATKLGQDPKPFDANAFTPQIPVTLRYPGGAIKRTWAFRHGRTTNDIKLEEVLEAATLRTAVLSAFQWDVEWILSKLKTPLNGGSTKCVFVMQAKEQEERDRMRQEASHMSSFLRLCFPPMYAPIWCMHSKLMLLFHPHKLRIAIPSANLLNFDWGETGHMENSVFIIDLPRLEQNSQIDDLTFFGKELLLFVEKQGIHQDVRDGITKFDFSATEGMAFVHTIGGVHYQDVAERTGLLGLSRAVKHLDLEANPDSLELDFAASSIGQLNAKYLQDFITSASGKNMNAEAVQAKSEAAASFFNSKKGQRKAKNGKESTPSRPNIENLRIYFPTKGTVQASTAGAAGTICLQRKYFEANTFPRGCFRDYQSTRLGLLSHNKLLCVRRRKPKEQRDIAWVYHGSANMSKSAWGELPADRTQRKITCRNWECGVLLPVPSNAVMSKREKAKARATAAAAAGEDAETASESEDEDRKDGVVGMEVFRTVVDLPFRYPGALYDGREPWYFTEEHGRR